MEAKRARIRLCSRLQAEAHECRAHRMSPKKRGRRASNCLAIDCGSRKVLEAAAHRIEGDDRINVLRERPNADEKLKKAEIKREMRIEEAAAGDLAVLIVNLEEAAHERPPPPLVCC